MGDIVTGLNFSIHKVTWVRNHVVNCDIQQELTQSKYAVYNREREGKTVFLF